MRKLFATLLCALAMMVLAHPVFAGLPLMHGSKSRCMRSDAEIVLFIKALHPELTALGCRFSPAHDTCPELSPKVDHRQILECARVTCPRSSGKRGRFTLCVTLVKVLHGKQSQR